MTDFFHNVHHHAPYAHQAPYTHQAHHVDSNLHHYSGPSHDLNQPIVAGGCNWTGASHACLDNINGAIIGGAAAGGIIGGATGGGILPGAAIGGISLGTEHCVSNVVNYMNGC
jgi:hypothetical protein